MGKSVQQPKYHLALGHDDKYEKDTDATCESERSIFPPLPSLLAITGGHTASPFDKTQSVIVSVASRPTQGHNESVTVL